MSAVAKTLAWWFFMMIPVAISLFLAFMVRDMQNHSHGEPSGETQIICFTEDTCAIQVQGKWYKITGIIDMNETVPDEFKIIEPAVEEESSRGSLRERLKDE